MGSRRLAAVADAGPLIHLAEIGRLSLLHIFKHVHIPDAVWEETVGQNRVSATELFETSLILRHTLSSQEVSDFMLNNNLLKLHTGERECLYLCQKINIFTLLTDDLSVRQEVKQRNWQPVGSLGIIVRAYKLGLLSRTDAEQCLDELYVASTLFVTRAIIDIAIQQLH
jgi:predicted nucleic acid-binding protein